MHMERMGNLLTRRKMTNGWFYKLPLLYFEAIIEVKV